MKKICISILLISNIIYSQTSIDRKVRLDSLFFETFENNYSYFRIAENYYEKLENYNIKDFYLSGNLLKEGLYKDNDAFIKNGKFTEYYENGYAKKELSYKKNQPYGTMLTWYENGNPKEVGFYSTNYQKETFYTLTDFWDIENKVLVGNGTGTYFVDDNECKASGQIVDGLKEGKWIGRSKKYKLNFIENYSLGTLIDGESIDDDNIKYQFKKTEEKAEYITGMNGYGEFIAKNFQVPNIQGLTGKIIARFFVEVDGTISDVKIIKGIGYGADEEAIRVLKMMKSWIPSKIYGKKVKSQFQLPISIMAPY